jgi:hypothetical protein
LNEEAVMGIGMQIVYLGFPGNARIEAEAAVQLLRLERFSRMLGSCHLAIEEISANQHTVFDARLDLVTPSGQLLPMPHCADDDPEAAVRAAFDHAERKLAGCDGMPLGSGAPSA